MSRPDRVSIWEFNLLSDVVSTLIVIGWRGDDIDSSKVSRARAAMLVAPIDTHGQEERQCRESCHQMIRWTILFVLIETSWCERTLLPLLAQAHCETSRGASLGGAEL